MANKRLPDFKKGDYFSLSCTHRENKTPSSLIGATIKAQVRNASGILVANLLAIIADQTQKVGMFTLTPANEDTSDWPVGIALIDIAIYIDGKKRTSQTFERQIIAPVTV